MMSDLVRELVEFRRIVTDAGAGDVAGSERIWQAIEDEAAFGMVFQPIVALRGGKTVGAEALARFNGPPKRPPNLWFAEADTVSLAVDLELVAVEKALHGLQDFPPGVYLSVNVSPLTLLDPRFCKLASQVAAHRLVLELTEHVRVPDYNRLVWITGKLREAGMRVAVDDVGAGFASLRHILKLRPDLIKLDMSLIRDIDLDPAKQALTASLIAFAEKSNAAIVAEGIESATELSVLLELGVTYGQGSFLGVPAPNPFCDSGR